MTDKDDNSAKLPGMSFDEALTRLLQTDPGEVADEFARVKMLQEKVKTDAEKRKKFIERAGQPTTKRFRL